MAAREQQGGSMREGGGWRGVRCEVGSNCCSKSELPLQVGSQTTSERSQGKVATLLHLVQVKLARVVDVEAMEEIINLVHINLCRGRRG